jgi:hypothetical protein
VACVKEEPKPWEFNGKTGVVHAAKLACVSASGEVASIKLKAKTADELTAKMARFTLGKPAEVQVTEIVPVYRQGDRKPSGYEYVS